MLLQQITLDDVIEAIRRAKKIRNGNINGSTLIQNQHLITLHKYSFFKENPDLDIHLVVEKIIKDCIPSLEI